MYTIQNAKNEHLKQNLVAFSHLIMWNLRSWKNLHSIPIQQRSALKQCQQERLCFCLFVKTTQTTIPPNMAYCSQLICSGVCICTEWSKVIWSESHSNSAANPKIRCKMCTKFPSMQSICFAFPIITDTAKKENFELGMWFPGNIFRTTKIS